MKNLLLHPNTRRQLDNFIKAPSHALLLIGPAGSGKRSLARHLSETILELPAGSFSTYPYQMIIRSDEGNSIGIEAVRQLEHFLSLKVPRRTAYNRAVVIEDVHQMSVEAQNAWLKTLEEPPAGVFIVASVTNDQALLPTIRSRVQSITIKPAERSAVETHFQGLNLDQQAIQQAYTISGGRLGLMDALLTQTDHPLMLAVQQARQLLSQPAYERLLVVDELAKQRSLALDTVSILQQMARVSLRTAAPDAATKWQAILVAAYQAAQALRANAQSKLVLTSLMLSL